MSEQRVNGAVQASPGASASTVPLFQEDWWLDAATSGRWSRAEVARDGIVIASLPFTLRRHGGLRYVGLPPYTRTVAPQLRAFPGKPVTQLGRTIKIVGELMARLPVYDRLELTLDPDTHLTFPFVSLGYLVTHHFTFVARAGASEDVLWHGLEQKTRNLVATAATRFALSVDGDLDRFLRLSRADHGVGARNRHDFAAIARLFEACAKRQQCAVLSAGDEHGDVAAAVVVWDRAKAYYWVSARDHRRAGAGGASLLFWQGVRLALSRGLAFDADSFANIESALFLSRFGLTPVVRPIVSRGSRAWRIAFLIRTALRPSRGDLFYRA